MKVIMIVTSSRIGQKVRIFTEQIMLETYLQGIFLHQLDVIRNKTDPTIIPYVLRSQSEIAMTLKRNQIRNMLIKCFHNPLNNPMSDFTYNILNLVL